MVDNTMARQFLTFMLDGELFGISILEVKEIIEYVDITEVPMMPPCVRGVINVRGAVVPVMDVVVRFGRPATAVSKKTCIVIIEMPGQDGHVMLGMLVDAVNAVLDISADDIEPPPAFGARMRNDFIAGMAKVDGKFVVLLNSEKVMSEDDIVNLSQHGPAALEGAAPALLA
jgi:purine-binding chemotaxis protein CheW